MNEYTVELSGDAQDDVVSIRNYTRDILLNPSAASKFVSDTEEAALSLEKFPYNHMVRPVDALTARELEIIEYLFLNVTESIIPGS